jgi:H+-translocating NAD(P) transhydrogenase subunit alpha
MAALIILLLVFGGSLGVGYLLISRVPARLHTPLMSMTNAISAVTILGALLLYARAGDWPAWVVGVVAVGLAAFNVVGGFAVTDRMLRLLRGN